MNFSGEPVTCSVEETESALGRRARSGDDHAKRLLVESLRPLALARARHFSGRSLPLDDARAVAVAAAVRAVTTFDPDRGPLIPYASVYITGALTRALRKSLRATHGAPLGSEADVATSEALAREPLKWQMAGAEGARVLAEVLDLLPSLPTLEADLLRDILAGRTSAAWAAAQVPPRSKAWAAGLYRSAIQRLQAWLGLGLDAPAPRTKPVTLSIADPLEEPWWATKGHDLDTTARTGDRGIYASGFPESQSDLWQRREHEDEQRRLRRHMDRAAMHDVLTILESVEPQLRSGLATRDPERVQTDHACSAALALVIGARRAYEAVGRETRPDRVLAIESGFWQVVVLFAGLLRGTIHCTHGPEDPEARLDFWRFSFEMSAALAEQFQTAYGEHCLIHRADAWEDA